MELKYRVITEQNLIISPKIRPQEKCEKQLDNRDIVILFKTRFKEYQ